MSGAAFYEDDKLKVFIKLNRGTAGYIECLVKRLLIPVPDSHDVRETGCDYRRLVT